METTSGTRTLGEHIGLTPAASRGLYDPSFEHDGCGVGFVASLRRQPSREVVSLALGSLGRLLHRGAFGADPRSGDGAGIMLQLPDSFLRRVAGELGLTLPRAQHYAVATVFLPRDPADGALCESMIVNGLGRAGLRLLGWRDVPCRPTAVGPGARRARPRIRQVFIAGERGSALECALYPARKHIEAQVRRLTFAAPDSAETFAITSCSSTTLVYKGQLSATQLDRFFPDLRSPDLVSALAVVHQRFSTNTEPSWRLAQPFRFIAHNGEINTLRGNRNWMRAREGGWRHPVCSAPPGELLPIIEPGGSDSAAADNTFEFLLRSGRSLPEAVMMMMPEAWEENRDCPPRRRAFYRYHSSLLEPWDGPAAIAFSDGRWVGAALDRNGLRPARYAITDELVVLASEAGVVPLRADSIRHAGRLRPGSMLLVDTRRGRVLMDRQIKAAVVGRHDYGGLVERGTVLLPHRGHPLPDPPGGDPRHQLASWQRCFGYTEEELERTLAPAARSGHEPVGSMGDDAPLAVLSQGPRLLFDYFSQGFAQVTNPPIDSIRERCVMSLRTSLGGGGDLLARRPEPVPRLELPHPVLTPAELEKIRALDELPSRTLATVFPAAQGAAGLDAALERLCQESEAAVAAGVRVLILSDRTVGPGAAPVPSLLALGAVHHHLVRRGVRSRLSLVVESGEPRNVHHLACLVGHGAEAVCPYLALAVVADIARRQQSDTASRPDLAATVYVKALTEGLLKVMSKMGISTIASYCGAQVFEAVGVAASVIDRCFDGTPARLQGADLEVVARETLIRHGNAFATEGADEQNSELGDQHRWRHGGERHAWTPETVASLQHAVRRGDPDHFRHFSELVDADTSQPTALRHLLEPIPNREVPLEEVEPATQIVRRFATGAMSLGSLGKEAHETLALAMNQIGAKSNTGEGGEDPERFTADDDGGSRRSAVKQVASARFGVDVHYLVNADDLQIKIAQGAKPGEGGQLPGHKVDAAIARLRHAAQGVELISPPPHHDIYSIEDLSQLIWDLKQANPRARVSVKLVAQAGVGTVAAGVVKARADHITISGHEGGTGAAPLSSIKHVGVPWELGLAETQQTLVRQGLRSRVTLQTDGGLRTGRDVVIAAMLGAEEFGFATAALVASGCVLMRVCHLNTCPVGIATQDPVLRQRFAGTPEHVVRYFMMVAEDVRRQLARLGFSSLAQAVGRVDRLACREGVRPWKAAGLDLGPLLHRPRAPVAGEAGGRGVASARAGLSRTRGQDHQLHLAWEARILGRAAEGLAQRRPQRFQVRVRNSDRAVGARLSGEVSRRHGGEGLPPDTLRLRLEGTAGQSLGAWLAPGVTVTCVGAANDYPGKGLSQGTLVVRVPRHASYLEPGHVIAGNVALYGATGGEAYFGGAAGERFAVRNSGAVAVVEGVGDHGCEYMTGGTVVILGAVGRNFAAGMTGGVAYVLDPGRRLRRCLNSESARASRMGPEDGALLLLLLRRHRRHTASGLAEQLLADWQATLAAMLRVSPLGVTNRSRADGPHRLPATTTANG
ncbi:MAG: glutamate synthase large subunit [Candidatus Dormibacteria bacterium]